MTIPASFLTALTRDEILVDLWLEIEGLPWGFGLTSRDASFFSARDWWAARLGVKALMVTIPGGAEQEVRPLDGDSSVGRISVQLLDDDSGAVMDLLANSARSDGCVALGAPADRAPSTTYALNDVVRVQNHLAGTAWNTYWCSTPGTTLGTAIAPAIDAATINDGSVVWTLIGPEDMDDSTTSYSIAYTGDAAGFTGGVFFIGRESVAYVSAIAGTNGGGRLYSPAQLGRGYLSMEGGFRLYAHTKGDWLSPYPRFVATRRARLFATLDGTDAGKVARWSGKIVGLKALPGLAGVELAMESVEAELKVMTFGGQRKAKLLAGIVDVTGAYEPATSNEPAFTASTVRFVRDSVTGSGWTTGQSLILKVGDEYLGVTLSVTEVEASGTVTARGLFSSAVEQHHPGEEVSEVLWTQAYDASGGPEAQRSKFTQGDHPFDVLLSFLTSRKGDGANGAYDVLPEGWGIGLDVARLDLAAIAALKQAWIPAARHLALYEEPFAFKEEMAKILRPHLCYPVSQLNDTLTFRRLNPPIPGLAIRTIDATDVVDVPSWDANIAEVVGRVIWRCDYDPVGGSFRQTFTGELQGPGVEAQEFYAGQFKTLEIEAQGQWSGNDPGVVGFFGAALSTAADEAARRYFETVRDRYSRPYPLVGVECDYEHITCVPGDLVAVTLENVPDPANGTRGLSLGICEVLRMTPDDLRGRVQLTLLHVSLSGNARLLAPSAIVTGTVSGTNYFGLSTGEFSPSGSWDGGGFLPGDLVEVRSPDLKTLRCSTTVVSLDGSLYMYVTAGTAVATAGDVVLLQPYSAQTTLRKALSAFLASPSALLGADPAHRYAS